MKPILYEAGEKIFATLGIGVLADAAECRVTEERNGQYELELRYPTTGVLYDDIQQDRVVLVKPNETDQTQPFRIYRISKPVNGTVTVYAEHISYQLNSIPVSPFTAGSAAAAVTGMMANSDIENPFTFTTDKSAAGTFSIEEPTLFRSRLFGVQGSLLDVYGGGEYKFDRWNVYLYNQRGQDNGVAITYGKNLRDATQDEYISNLITGVRPFWRDNEGNYVELPEKVLTVANNYSHERIEVLDLSSEFDDEPTVNELRKFSENYLASTSKTTPTVSVSVSFVPLWQTENFKSHPLYEQIAGLERVSLCDTVTVRYPIGIDVTAKVVKTVYDCLAERYESIDIGEARAGSTSQIIQGQQDAEHELHSGLSDLEKAFLQATNAITGATGGHVVLDPPQHPQRILIMDTPNKGTAVRVWQWNLNGLGYSSTGINGPYRLAMTTNPGAIVADFITAGTLNANIIKAGTISDRAGKNTINLETGDVSMQGSFTSESGSSRMALNSGLLRFYLNNARRLQIGPSSSTGEPQVWFYDEKGNSTSGLSGGTSSIGSRAEFDNFWLTTSSGRLSSYNGESYLQTQYINGVKCTWQWLTINGTSTRVLVGS